MEKMLFQAALEIQTFFADNDWQFAFIGGLANLRWGQQRVTEDVDCTLLTSFVDEEKIIDTVLARFPSRILSAKEFALNNRVLLLTTTNGVSADVSLGGIPFEENLIDRATLFEFDDGFVLRTCSAEDLVVLKAFAARDKDWADVRLILEKQKSNLDSAYVLHHLRLLAELKEEPEIMARLENML
jgi:hypothetical protein